MKTLLLYLSGVLLSATAINAQPVLTAAANAPVAGDILTQQSTKIAGFVKPSTGANKVWDYSSLVDSGDMQITHYLPAAGTPYTSQFPGANLVDTTINGGIIDYTYYTTGNSFTLLGGGTFGSPGGDDTIFYSPPLNLIPFPVSYGASGIDSTTVYNHAPGMIDTAKENRSGSADGWGTLTLPGGASYSVLRLTTIDTIRFLAFPGSFINSSINFLTPGYHGALLSISLDAAGIITDVQYAKDVTLPVSLLSFTGSISGSNTQLQWQTANESNMSSYNVQRSTDAIHFTDVTAIKAKGTAGNYSYADNVAGLSVSKVYYRLQQVDKNGKITYSNTVVVTLKGKGASFTILPNPARNYFTIIPDAGINISNATIAIRNMAGSTVLSQKLTNNGEQKVNVSFLPKGIYMVSIEAQGKTQSQKIVVE